MEGVILCYSGKILFDDFNIYTKLVKICILMAFSMSFFVRYVSEMLLAVAVER